MTGIAETVFTRWAWCLASLLLLCFLAIFAARAILPLPIWQTTTAPLPFTTRFDSPEALLLEANQTLAGLLADRRQLSSATLKDLQASVSRSLALRPMNPQAWLVLAQLSYLLGDEESALHQLQNSFERGPYETIIAAERIDLAVRLWFLLPQAMKERTLEQVVWAWGQVKPEILDLARQSPNHETLIARALAVAPDQQERFLRALGR